MLPGRTQFFAGLFLTTLATLLLEILNTRLLSVITWYHLSFFAVSTAMFGMSVGAIRVYLGGADFEGEAARDALARYTGIFALSIPLSHIAILCIPIRAGMIGQSGTALAGLVLMTLAVSAPFYYSGIVVAISLTRIPLRPGLVYAVDLVGAALGSLLILPLLESFDISSTAFISAAIAAAAAACFHQFADTGRTLRVAALGFIAIALAGANAASPGGLRVLYSKGGVVAWNNVVSEDWSIHGRVLTMKNRTAAPYFWGAGKGARKFKVNLRLMDIDGLSATSMTKWDGLTMDDLAWVRHDVTSLAYHLRKGGDAGVIGVGGGRDLLTALWGESRSVIGVEINGALVHNLKGPFRDYANLADRPDVEIIHDEARSYFTRTERRFDVLQMSLIDTWAATGAGAFTLSENGLYTLDGWREFLRVLKPSGIFTVSRWYTPERPTETSRLISLAVAALLEQGITNPSAHLILAARHKAATLLISKQPFGSTDMAALDRAVQEMEFQILLAPGVESVDPALDRIVAVHSRDQLDVAIQNEFFDYSPPTDQRPYFFNILKPGTLFRSEFGKHVGVLGDGNLIATRVLSVLWIVSFLLVMTAIIFPLARSGLPKLEQNAFIHSLLYFAVIGLGFMLVQIPFIQRFSIYLGHPTYAVAVILFSMILLTGAGSFMSDLLPIEEERRWVIAIPLVISGLILASVLSLQPIIDATLRLGLFARASIVVAIVGIVALPLGFCFPIGLRLVRRLSDDATPWMWGINGACSVLSTVSAVWISMWSGIDTGLYIAAALYLFLIFPASALWSKGRDLAP